VDLTGWVRRRPQSGVAVSVIVPVYNTGEPIHELIASLDGQTMPQSRFEVIFVDDGSTDGTGDVLDELARSHPNWVVRHIPNSGWPGTPRNLGLDLARGEFVAFVDHDDYLGRTGLQTVYDFARRHRSDVVVAREIGVGRHLGRFMFRANVVNASLERDPLVRLLTPHKVYRRSLLVEHGIRFPEGRVRLEDHLFNMQAYFAAKRVSILSDCDYYYWTYRLEHEHASSQLKDPGDYIEVAVNRVLDLIDANTRPGPARDRIASHWLEKKVFPIMRGELIPTYPPEYTQEVFAATRALVLARFPESTDVHLSLSGRMRAHVVRTGTVDDLVALAVAEHQVTSRVVAEQVEWEERAALLHLRIELVDREGAPIEFRRDGDQVFWCPPPGPDGDDAPDLPIDVSREVLDPRVLLMVKRRGAAQDVTIAPRGTMALEAIAGSDRCRAVYTGVARLPLHEVAALASRPGDFVVDFHTEFNVLGWRSTRRVAAAGDDLDPRGHPDGPTSGRFYTTNQGNLSLKAHRAPGAAVAVHRSPTSTSWRSRRLVRSLRRRVRAVTPARVRRLVRRR
jgi:glycosyltransferase involved in cell wall biosynthesis